MMVMYEIAIVVGVLSGACLLVRMVIEEQPCRSTAPGRRSRLGLVGLRSTAR